jgi:spore coat protein U-like protein
MNKRMNVLPSIAAGVLSLAAITNVNAAGSLTGDIAVKLVIGAGCSVLNGSVTGGVNHWGVMDFGTQSNLTSAVNADVLSTSGLSSVTINCSTGLTSTLTLNGGQYGSASLRNLSSDGTNRIPYRLYSNAARTTEIGLSAPIALIANGTAQNIPIFGRILPADQSSTTPAAGTYNDTIIATLAW